MKLFLCLDLEATCFEECSLEDMESVEIGVVAVDETGASVGEFQSYIRPAYTRLTDFCAAITGIGAAQLENAKPLDGVVEALKAWQLTLPTRPSVWYSWGNYDLRQLELDTGPARWRLPLPLPVHRNAKKLFRQRQIRKGREVGLARALDLMGLAFQGRPHSALDDARNLARLFPYFHEQDSDG